MIVREMKRQIDVEKLADFDASFSTDRIYRVSVKEISLEIIEQKLAEPLHKSYSLDSIKNDIAEADYTVIAEDENVIAGLATVKYEAWNNRAVLTGIFVAAQFRGKRLGQTLIESIENYAQTKQARCLFVETQNVNYPAIRFYRKSGFEFCGFDTSLYNPADVLPGETAFYFCKQLSK